MSVPHNEVDVLLDVFMEMLRHPSGDGRKKRKAGDKPPWWRDDSHEAAMFSHISKWKHGEKIDKDSGTHPLVHLAWRSLAVAYQEMNGQVDPAGPVKEESKCFISLQCHPVDYHHRKTEEDNAEVTRGNA